MHIKLRKQCGIISKIRHYAPRSALLQYYDSNNKSIIQYGVLIYIVVLARIHFYSFWKCRKNHSKYFLRNRDSFSILFERAIILTVHELYIYELLKILCRSLASMHTSNFLNNIFENNTYILNIRTSKKRSVENARCSNYGAENFNWVSGI